jgi:hypothetical protein
MSKSGQPTRDYTIVLQDIHGNQQDRYIVDAKNYNEACFMAGRRYQIEHSNDTPTTYWGSPMIFHSADVTKYIYEIPPKDLRLKDVWDTASEYVDCLLKQEQFQGYLNTENRIFAYKTKVADYIHSILDSGVPVTGHHLDTAGYLLGVLTQEFFENDISDTGYFQREWFGYYLKQLYSKYRSRA